MYDIILNLLAQVYKLQHSLTLSHLESFKACHYCKSKTQRNPSNAQNICYHNELIREDLNLSQKLHHQRMTNLDMSTVQRGLFLFYQKGFQQP